MVEVDITGVHSGAGTWPPDSAACMHITSLCLHTALQSMQASGGRCRHKAMPCQQRCRASHGPLGLS